MFRRQKIRTGIKYLAVVWILLVYGFYSWNVIPDTLQTIQPRLEKIKLKILSRGSNPSAEKAVHTVPRSPAESDPTSQKPATEPTSLQTSAQNDPSNSSGRLHAFPANLLKIITAFWIFLFCNFWGKKILSWLKADPMPAETAASTALGLGGLSFLVFGMGWLGWFGRIPFLVLIAVLGIPALIRFRLPSLEWIREIFKQRLLSLFLLPVFIIFLFSALIPDQFYDTLQYHLALPQTYLLHGGIVPTNENAYSGFPQIMEMLYTLGLGLGGDDTIPLLIQFGTGFLLFLALTQNQKFFPGAMIPAVLFITCPITVEHIRFCKPDVFLTLCITLAFFCLAHWEKGKPCLFLILSGIFSGLALSAKYSGGVFAGALIILLLWKNREEPLKTRVRHLLAFTAPVLALFLPWVLKNAVWYGNPLYPFLKEVFDPASSHLRGMGYLEGASAGIGVFRDLLSHFFQMTFKGHTYPSMNYVGPVWLAFLPVTLLASLKSPSIKPALIYVFSFYCLSAVFSPNWGRYFFFPVLPLLAHLTWRAVRDIEENQVKKILTMLLGVGIMLHGLGWIPLLERVSYGRSSLWGLSEDRKRNLYAPGYYDSVNWVNKHCPENAKILFLGETKSHLFQRKVIAPSINNEHPISIRIRQSKTGRDLYRRLTRSGITHLLLNRKELIRLIGYPMFRWKNGDETLLKNFWNRHLEEKYSKDSVSVYEIMEQTSNPPDFPQEMIKLIHQ